MQNLLKYIRRSVDTVVTSSRRFRSWRPWKFIAVVLLLLSLVHLVSFAIIAEKHSWRILIEAPGRVLARGVAFLASEHPEALFRSRHHPGFIYIDAPQVYTRERLVNDRFRESAWLERMLERTENASMRELPSRRQASGGGSRVSFGEYEKTGRANDGEMKPLHGTGLEDIQAFNRSSVLRERIRVAQMDTMLDDAHDLDGNTLYRLNFGATVIPSTGRRVYPGSAVFVITAKKWKARSNDDIRISRSDERELIVDLEKELQYFFDRAMIIQINRFFDSGRLYSPHNAAEAQAFEYFLMEQLKGLFKKAFVDHSGELKRSAQDLGEAIAELEILRAMLHDGEVGVSNQHHTCFARLQEMLRNSGRPWFQNLLIKLRELSLTPRVRSSFLEWPTEQNPGGHEQNVSGCHDDPFNLKGQLSLARLRGLLRLTAILKKADRVLDNLNPKDLIEEIQNRDRTQTWLEGELGALVDNKLTFRMERENCSEPDEKTAIHELIGCMLRRHDATTEVQRLFAMFLLMRMENALDDYFFKHPPSPKASEYFNFKIIGCSTGQCRVRLVRKHASKPVGVGKSTSEAAEALMNQLEDQRHHLEVYQISPRRLGTLVEALNATETSVGFGVDEINATLRRQATTNETFDEPLAFGFSDITSGSADKAVTHHSDETTFGWIVQPRRHPTAMVWRPEDLHFSVILSVPSWWKRLELEISSCWVSPHDTANLSKGIREEPMNVCKSSLSPSWSEKQKKRQYIVQLPRQLDEVRARFELDVLKAPYFDAAWLENEASRIILEAGRPGAMVLIGERLWRSTEVILGGVRADRIRVLPDMKGIFAEFDCVPFPSGRHYVAEKRRTPAVKEQNSEEHKTPAVVWTSEGRAVGLNVKIARFTARTEKDAPCLPASDYIE